MNTDSEKLEQLRVFLSKESADFEILNHDITLVSSEDGVMKGVGTLEEMAPTLILETEKGLLAATISGATKISYKKIKKELGLKNVSLANPQKILQTVGVPVGIIPLVTHKCPTIIDSKLAALTYGYGGCGVHCHTLKIAVKDLIRINNAKVFDFTENKL